MKLTNLSSENEPIQTESPSGRATVGNAALFWLKVKIFIGVRSLVLSSITLNGREQIMWSSSIPSKVYPSHLAITSNASWFKLVTQIELPSIIKLSGLLIL